MMTKLTSIAVATLLVIACGGGQTTAQTTSNTLGTKSPIGGGCTSDDDCTSGLFCDKDDPGGQCLKKCATTADCGSGAVCSDEKKCYQACQKPTDCTRRGYACQGTAPNMFCDTAGESGEHH